MKKIATLITLLLCALSLFAQAPENFTYQAVVRNASNALVTNAQVGVRVNILQGTASGNAVYSETHIVSTNANGLVTVNIGGGSVLHGSFADIDWSDGPYFLKTDIDPNGGNDYSITSVQQLLSVPYALYAKEAANSFSGDYNDLVNVPQIPQIPADISAFNNDVGYITAAQIPEQVNADWNATTGVAEILNKPAIPTVPSNVSAFTNDAGYITGYTETDPQYNAWDKDYNDLINKPTIPTVPTNVSAFTNDVGYITDYTETDPQYNAWDKDYNDLINKPTIPTVPTNVSAFTNDAGYITQAQVPVQVNADWSATTGAALILNKPNLFSGDYNDLINKPVLFSGNYNDLTNKPTLFDGNYNSLTNRPNLAAVALSGSYNDLINKPAIPTAVGELTNNVGYITAAQLPTQVNADWNATSGAAQILNKPTLFSGNYNDLTNLPQIPQIPVDISAFNNDAGYLTSYTETDPQFNAWDKDYNDLTNKPTIPTVPTNVSAFTNDAGYLTSFTEQQVLSISHDTLFLTGGSFVKLPAGFDGDYNSLTNKPAIPTVPTNVSAFTNDAGYITNSDIPAIPTVPTNVSAFNNDAGYITGYTETDPQFNAWDKDYNDLINKPTIPTVPTNVSAFTNDAGYITMDSVPAIPTNVGAFTNDAGYITGYTETDPQFNAWDKNYNDLTNKPTIPTVPTNVSAFTNDAGYITMDSVPAIPTNVSAFTNDAGYLTEVAPQTLSLSGDELTISGGNTVTIPISSGAPGRGITNIDGPVSEGLNDTYTIHYTDGTTSTFVVTNGAAGADGTNGIDGEDGEIGPEGPEGPEGPAGVGIVSIAKTGEDGNTDIYTITYTDESTSQFSVTNGVNGQDGVSPTVTAEGQGSNVLITVTDGSGTHTYTIPITNGEVTQLPADWTATSGVQMILNKPNLATVATTGNYTDLTNKPTIPTVPTNVSAFTNDAGYLSSYTETDPEFNAWDKNYNDLTNKPTLFSGNYNDLTNKPILFDGNYNSLTNKPNLSIVATTGNYNDLVNKPTLFSGNYNDLTNKPTIPTVNNATLTIQKNGSNVGTFTANQNTNQTVNIIVPTTTSQLTNNSGFITASAIPGNVGAFSNDAGYITQDNLTTILNTLTSTMNSRFDSLQTVIDSLSSHLHSGDDNCCTALGNTIDSLQQQLDALHQIVAEHHFICGTSTAIDHEGKTTRAMSMPPCRSAISVGCGTTCGPPLRQVREPISFRLPVLALPIRASRLAGTTTTRPRMRR